MTPWFVDMTDPARFTLRTAAQFDRAITDMRQRLATLRDVDLHLTLRDVLALLIECRRMLDGPRRCALPPPPWKERAA